LEPVQGLLVKLTRSSTRSKRDIVRWAVKQGRQPSSPTAAWVRAFMQLEWARLVQDAHRTGPVLIVAPIAVGQQTIDEVAKLGITVTRVQEPQPDSRHPDHELRAPAQVPPHEVDKYAGIVLDESSILKSIDGKTRTLLLKEWVTVPTGSAAPRRRRRTT
jgi:hypothetical protein